jgi:hypothetical protein
LLRVAEEDERVVAGAAVGSLAVDGGDRFSDLDLTFGTAGRVLRDAPASDQCDANWWNGIVKMVDL